MYQAPEDGYEKNFILSYGHGEENFDAMFTGSFYIKSRNGQNYAKIYFDMNTFWDQRGVPFGIKSYINTNHSRVLEVQPDKVTNLNRDKPYGRW